MLQHLSLPSLNRTNVLIKVGLLVILLTCSMEILAGCRADQAGGWNVFTLCGANFDSQGNYVNSTCQDAGPPTGSETVFDMCMPAAAVGGCSGSLCVWDGPLNE